MSQLRVRRKRIVPGAVSSNTTPSPVNTAPAPVNTAPAPVNTAPAPVKTSPAPVKTAPTPVKTTPAAAPANTVGASQPPVNENPQPLKKMKKRINKTQGTNDEKKEGAQNTVSDDIIPEIDISSTTETSLNSNSNFYSLSRKKSSIFDDEFDKAPAYLSPNYDLSTIKTIETQRYLNKNSVEVNKKFFLKAMEEKENEFRETFQKSEFKASNEEIIFDPKFMKEELENVIHNNCSKVLGSVEKFSIDKCNLSNIEVKKDERKISDNILNRIYFLSKDEAIQYLKGNDKNTFYQMKKELNIEMIKDDEEKFEENPFYKEAENFLSIERGQVIDLGSPEFFSLLCKIADFFNNGLKVESSVLFQNILQQYFIDINEKPELLIIQHDLLICEQQEKSSYILLAKKIVQLIQSSQCSTLLNYLSTLKPILKESYYEDSPINEEDECYKYADIISKIECYTFVGEFPFKNISQFGTPISYKQLSERISNGVEKVLLCYRTAILKRTNINEKDLIDIIRYFFKVFLTKKTGEIIPLDCLWDIFQTLSNSSFNHPSFEKFKKIINHPEVSGSFYRYQKALKATIFALNEKILPYIILFTINHSTIKEIPDPEYIQNPTKCITLSHSFLNLSSINLNLKYETIKTILNL